MDWEEEMFRKILSLNWHYNIPGDCREDEIAKAAAHLSETSSIELRVLLASVKLAIARKFFRDANLSWVNEESCSTAKLT